MDVGIPIEVAFSLFLVKLNWLLVISLNKTNNFIEALLLLTIHGGCEEVVVIQSVLNISVHVS